LCEEKGLLLGERSLCRDLMWEAGCKRRRDVSYPRVLVGGGEGGRWD